MQIEGRTIELARNCYAEMPPILSKSTYKSFDFYTGKIKSEGRRNLSTFRYLFLIYFS